MDADGKAPPTAADDLQDLVAGALAAHDEGGETKLAAYLDALGPRRTEVAAVLDRFLGLGVLARPVARPALPERLGEFRLVRRLGAGGMGVVFLAEHATLRREVALKVVRPELLIFEGARERFRREVEAIARLRHPGIVPIVAVGEECGIPFFAMELVEGRTAEDVTAALAGRDPASLSGEDLWQQVRGAHAGAAPAALQGAWWRVVVRLCAQVAHAMHHAHVRGIVHRDLKPSNIMLTPHGSALVLDFGLAWFDSSGKITRTGTELGSPAYMSPEQVRGEPLDRRTDVYSLGATLYQMLCLTPPFTGRDAHDLRGRVLAGVVPPLRARYRGLGRDVEIVCLKALDLDRGRRYASMAEFAADLEALAEGRPVAARRLGRAQRAWRWARRHRAASAALAVGVLALALLPALLWLQQQRANRLLQAQVARAQRSLAVSKEAIQTMLVRLGEVDLGSVPGAETLRPRLLQEAVALYERLLADPEDGDDASLRLERANTLVRVANMQYELGRFADAEKAVAETIAITGGDSLAAGDEDLGVRVRARQTLAVLRMGRGDYPGAERELTRKRSELEELLRRGSADASARHALISTLTSLAECARQQGDGSRQDGEARERLLREALAQLDALLAERPGDPHLVRHRAATMQDLALALQDQDRFVDAHAVLDEEIALVEPLADDRNARPRKAELLMLAWSTKGSTSFEAGDFAASVREHARSVEFAEQLVRDFPAATGYASRLGSMRMNLASAHQRMGRHDVAEPLLRRALAEQRAAVQRNPEYAEGRRFLGWQLRALARSLFALGRRAELVATGEELGRMAERARDAFDAAGILADAFRLPEPEASAEPPFDRAAVARRAVEFLLDAERRGWPEGLKFDRERLAPLGEDPELAALAARRGG